MLFNRYGKTNLYIDKLSTKKKMEMKIKLLFVVKISVPVGRAPMSISNWIDRGISYLNKTTQMKSIC